MTTAILSDIHGNLEALEAVLAELDRRKPDRVICLGDIVGYGASPNECLDHVRKRCGTVLLGNHDAAASGGPEAARFNIYARVAAEWTMKTLTRDNREYLQRLPLTANENSFYLVHASPACPRDWEYLLDRFDAEPQFHYFTEMICFIGHTHQPAIYLADQSGTKSLPLSEGKLDPSRRYIVNVGSVGQPRDHDPRACFVLYHESSTTIEYVRVPYDIEGAQSKIRAAQLPEVLAARLATGE
ncbi:MAG TPA: metallophosphoesterase family protein [Candidatus Eisenbacteria bacterium]|jgi:diadenosine tetraphosphatase ApaH/serine/threonine PP2A family protein phosphatase|nr:metallophosphoesterase family protein [Candidatus Eisenbacteria bacterium]